MYIKSVVLDGFKSYSTRTELKDFDNNFNAITGLNGSGKSNILDAICFVLGIPIKHVRASSHQELIYKNGQAGITKATVTITFDNTDKSKSPIGYENDDKIVIARQSYVPNSTRYLINGTNIPNKRVIDLFHSVGLNVENPHFIILQGRVTKVLNMKPKEILDMLEDAAGLGQYEQKRSNTLKLMEKKDTKIDNLNHLINEQIAPKIEKLKGEKTKYLELQVRLREVEHFGKVYFANKFWLIEESAKEKLDLLRKKTGSLKKGNETIEKKEEEIKKIQEKILKVESSIAEESNGTYYETEMELLQERTNEAVRTAEYKSQKEEITAAEKRLKVQMNSIQEDEEALKRKEKEVTDMDIKYEKQRKEDDEIKNSLKLLTEEYAGLTRGMFLSSSGEFATIQDQIINIKTVISRRETEAKQNEMKLSSIVHRIPKVQKQFNQSENDNAQDEQLIKKKKTDIKKLEVELKNINYKDRSYEELAEEIEQLTAEKRKKNNELSALYSKNWRLEFVYDNTDKLIDPNNIKGRVCKLFKLKDKKYELAVETLMGGGMYNVVVDGEQTSQLLIEYGKLKHRSVFFPLNKGVGKYMDKKTLEAVKDVAGRDKDAVIVALSVLEFDPIYENAIRFAIGNTVICKNGTYAETMAFGTAKVMAVTLDGDLYDSGGTLSGGVQPNKIYILPLVEKILIIESAIKKLDERIAQLHKQIKILSPIFEKYCFLTAKRDELLYELNTLEAKFKRTTFYAHKEEYESLIAEKTKLEKSIKECKEFVKTTTEELQNKEKNMNNIDSLRDDKLKQVQKKMTIAKEKLEKFGNTWKQHETAYETKKLEIVDLKSTIDKDKQNLEEAKKDLESMKEIGSQLEAASKEVKERVKILEAEIKQQKDSLTAKNSTLQQLRKDLDNCVADVNRLSARREDLELDIETLERNRQKDLETAEKLEREHTFITTDKEGFGTGHYTFTVDSLILNQKKYENAKDSKDKLERTVNKRAMQSLEAEESNFKSAMKRRDIVVADKRKLENVMAQLDKMKKIALDNAFLKVNKDFGSIFHILLPDANVKLSPIKPNDLTSGIEVKVAFGNHWKDSLSELSGGQRSLIALSLILAMLLFNPAPIYVLDEVDAALDLSHTQNIGIMLHKYFKTSQFIIVSLKDGFFKNANVLFRTSFQGGTSFVSREVNKNRPK